MTARRHTVDITDNPCEGRASVILLTNQCNVAIAGNTVRDDGEWFVLELAGSRRKPMRFATVVAAVRKLKRLASAQARRQKKACLAQL